MIKCRIIKRINPFPGKSRLFFNGPVTYVIQQKHFLFRWRWVDANVNALLGPENFDEFNTLKEAKENLCRFDGSRCTEEVILIKEIHKEI